MVFHLLEKSDTNMIFETSFDSLEAFRFSSLSPEI